MSLFEDLAIQQSASRGLFGSGLGAQQQSMPNPFLQGVPVRLATRDDLRRRRFKPINFIDELRSEIDNWLEIN